MQKWPDQDSIMSQRAVVALLQSYILIQQWDLSSAGDNTFLLAGLGAFDGFAVAAHPLDSTFIAPSIPARDSGNMRSSTGLRDKAMEILLSCPGVPRGCEVEKQRADNQDRNCE